jgi:hypothetical protein
MLSQQQEEFVVNVLGRPAQWRGPKARHFLRLLRCNWSGEIKHASQFFLVPYYQKQNSYCKDDRRYATVEIYRPSFFFFFEISIYLQSVPEHSANCVKRRII